MAATLATLFFVFLLSVVRSNADQSCIRNEYDEDGDSRCDQNTAFVHKHGQQRYLLYEVNPGEGFNLRRDVYMRVARLARSLQVNSKNEWMLVLPPWGPLYHWKSEQIRSQMQIPWSQFFDLEELNKYTSVIEFSTFLQENGPLIDWIYYLQNYAGGWSGGEWIEKYDIQKCNSQPPYKQNEDKLFRGWFWGYSEVAAKNVSCLSVQGYSSTLKPLILQQINARSIMIDRAEVILHEVFGDAEYWKIRKTMKFSKHLKAIGNEFRKKYLDSDDEKDHTMPNTDGKPLKPGSAKGGPFIAVHLRRQDYLHSRPSEVPDLKWAAKQIEIPLKKLNLNKVFVSTDASQEEFEEFKSYIPSAVRYSASSELLDEIGDGGVAIVDQWICSHARYFVGSYESTFSFRIQEEREILGFHPDTTFNRLCGTNITKCEQPAKWRIVYG